MMLLLLSAAAISLSLFSTRFSGKEISIDVGRVKRRYYKLTAIVLAIALAIQLALFLIMLPYSRNAVTDAKQELSASDKTAMLNEIDALSNAIIAYLNDYENAIDTFMYNGALAFQMYDALHNPTIEEAAEYAKKTGITEFEAFKINGDFLWATMEQVEEGSFNLFSISEEYRGIVDGTIEQLPSNMKVRIETGQIFKFTAVPRFGCGWKYYRRY
ncbi:MAG: hypothetical protein PHE79_03270 [Eubacteriales bacterium]|nr:hypothetical protein [Eubacteriales bacterium]